jgi:hypothetical protein
VVARAAPLFTLGVVVQIVSHGVRAGLPSLLGGLSSPIIAGWLEHFVPWSLIGGWSAGNASRDSLPRTEEHSKLVVNNQPTLCLGNCVQVMQQLPGHLSGTMAENHQAFRRASFFVP